MDNDGGFQRLLERAQRGDRGALGEIYERYLPHLERVLKYRLRKAGLANVTTSADVQDSVFRQLLRPGALDKITGDKHLRYFLIRACVNKVSDILAKRRFGQQGLHMSSEDVVLEQVARSPHADTIDQLEHEEQLAIVYSQLAPRERLLCMLRRAGYGWDEIAERLDMKPEVARQIFSRGLRRAREFLQELSAAPPAANRRAGGSPKHSRVRPKRNLDNRLPGDRS